MQVDRPRRFSEVVGQGHITPILRAMVKTGRVAQALRFEGASGVGKTTCARIFASALNCESPVDGDACAECGRCLLPEALDQYKGKWKVITYGKWKVVMYEQAHLLSEVDVEELLKTLEDPPEHTVFIFLTTQPADLSPAIASRTMSFEFRRLTHEEIVGRLQLLGGPDAPLELLDLIAEKSQGDMRTAIMLLAQVTAADISDAEGFRNLFGVKNLSLPLLTAAITGDFVSGIKAIDEHFCTTGDAAGVVRDLVNLVRDLLVSHSGGDLDPSLTELAESVSLPKLIGSMRLLWDLKARGQDSDQKAAMYMAFALLVDELRDKADLQPITTSTNGTLNQRLSIDDMRKAVSILGKKNG